jgi:hypothetical protein
MSILTDLFTGSATSAITAVGDVAKKFITTDQDRMAFELESAKITADFQNNVLTHADSYETEITDRQKNDMQSDSWLSKNIRPMIMIYLLVLVTLMGFGIISVQTGFMDMIQSFTTYGLGFYFGGRSLEKISKMATVAWVSTKK